MTLLILSLTVVSSFFHPSESRLSLDYYATSCPQFSEIIQDTVNKNHITNPTTVTTLRHFLHDCLLNDSNASILLSSTPFNKAERDTNINLSLDGYGFNVVVHAKTTLELTCPNTISCADILVVATRNLVTMLDEPYYNVYLGRGDGRVSMVSGNEGDLPGPTMPMTQLIEIFSSRGFSIEEMVALSGAHTIGFSHCSEFSCDIFNYSLSSGLSSITAQNISTHPTPSHTLRITPLSFLFISLLSSFLIIFYS